jgi:acetyl esterase/lipase
MARVSILIGVFACFGGQSLLAQELPVTATANKVVPVWPDSPPAWAAPMEAERDTSTASSGKIADKPVIRLGFVSHPELHVYLPKQKATDTTVLIAPGGGYSILAWDLEGTEIAQWLQGIGVTAIVVKYRVPTGNAEQKWLAPVQDIQRSIRLVRSGAIEGVNPKQVGVLGFSAGGNASARVATATKSYYDSIDPSDEASVIPDFAVLIYPAWLNQKDDPHQMDAEIQVTEKSPPTFFAAAQDDHKYVLSCVTMFRALNERQVPSALHIFERGGHGFGGRVTGLPTDAWPGLCETWMRDRGWLK